MQAHSDTKLVSIVPYYPLAEAEEGNTKIFLGGRRIKKLFELTLSWTLVHGCSDYNKACSFKGVWWHAS